MPRWDDHQNTCPDCGELLVSSNDSKWHCTNPDCDVSYIEYKPYRKVMCGLSILVNNACQGYVKSDMFVPLSEIQARGKRLQEHKRLIDQYNEMGIPVFPEPPLDTRTFIDGCWVEDD